MTADEQKVLDFILRNPGLKNRAIASVMGIPMGTVNGVIVRLRKDGHIKPAVTDVESSSYGQCWPTEPQCPDTAVDASVVALPPLSGSTTNATESGPSDGEDASVVLASRSDLDATPIVQMQSVDASPSDSPTPTPDVQAALEAAKELAEENERLRKKVESLRNVERRQNMSLQHVRSHRNALESDLSDISWLCESAGFTGSGDTVDQLCWLLDHLGHPNFARAIPARRSALRKIQEGEEELRGLQMQVRLDLPRETDDRCRCGREATKVEGEEGFTQCDPCFHREGGE
ncbi:MAG: hypothetical protein EBS68_15345 [Rhodobacteraceae bacterium]|nr:hypothetical protein [Paracoccaceae bacterium]